LKNRGIESYKKQRGFPLNLGENEQMLFSFDHKITYEKLLKMKTAREKEEQKEQQNVKRKGFQMDQDEFFDGCDDLDSIEAMDNLKPIKKKTTFQPLADGKHPLSLHFAWISTKRNNLSIRVS
jgi:hypothetical protein